MVKSLGGNQSYERMEGGEAYGMTNSHAFNLECQ